MVMNEREVHGSHLKLLLCGQKLSALSCAPAPKLTTTNMASMYMSTATKPKKPTSALCVELCTHALLCVVLRLQHGLAQPSHDKKHRHSVLAVGPTDTHLNFGLLRV